MNIKDALKSNLHDVPFKRESKNVPTQKYVTNLVNPGKRKVCANTTSAAIKRGTSHSDHVHVKIYGCDNCIWRCTKFCPHSELNGGSVSFSKPHSNRICSVRKDFVYDNMLEIVGLKAMNRVSLADEMVFRDILDDAFIANYKKNKALQSGEEVEFKQALDWSKHSADIKLRWLKHKEGSKVTVKREVTPADLADLMDKARVVEAEVIDNA